MKAGHRHELQSHEWLWLLASPLATKEADHVLAPGPGDIAGEGGCSWAQMWGPGKHFHKV